MDILEILKAFGPAVAGVAAVGWGMWIMLRAKDRIIKAKDEEIARLNEERIKEKQAATDQLLQIVGDFNSLQEEQNKTLALLHQDQRSRR